MVTRLHPVDPPTSPSRRWSARGAAAALLAVLVLLDPGAGQAQTPPSDTPEVLRPGDLVHVQVWRQEEFTGEYRVTPEGRIAHPLYRQVEVEGRPVADVEEDLRGFLSEYEANPEFVVEGLFQVAVGGEVREPTVHALPPGTTVAEAVAMAGGISEDGALDRVILRRGGEEYELDLTDPATGVREVTIRSGDEVVVERDRDTFRDYIVPAASIVGAAASVARVFY